MMDLDPQTLLFCLSMAFFAVPVAWFWAIHFGPLRGE